MTKRLSVSSESLTKLAIVSCLLLPQFACDQAISLKTQATSVKTQAFSVKAPNSSVGETASSKLNIDLAVDKKLLGFGEFVLIAVLKSAFAEEVSFLPWASPFEKNITGDFLTIVDLNAGIELSYLGVMVKRMPPKPSDYLSVAPQQTIKNTLDLSKSYKFCAHQKLKIVFSGVLYNRFSEPYRSEVNSLELVLPSTFPGC